VDEINGKEIYIQRIGDSRIEVNTGRVDPQRTGLFGVLSLGFIVGAVLTVLGFFLYSFLSFERRLLQMGILRAMGLSVRQLFTLLVFEQVFLIFVGVAAGTILGVLTGDLYIPFFQIGQEKQVPPFVVTTAWEDIGRLYLVLGVMLLLGLASTIWLISRMQLSRSVKLGEEQ
jgi:putative ABC transport system permease protein